MQGDISKGAFTLLHNQLVGYMPFTRLDEVFVDMSVRSEDGTVQRYQVPYSVRERRPLCVFDGEIPQDGVAQSSRQVMSEDLFQLAPSVHHTRKVREYQLAIPLPDMLVRRFIIVPQGVGVLIRFREKTLARRFVAFELAHVRDATWQYSSLSATA
jgi:hypothetical protein